MDDYDQACRFTVRLDPPGFGRWLLGPAARRTFRAVLPLIPLMRGGGMADTISRWKQVAAAEPDDRLRSNYAGLIRFFARLTRAAGDWARALEGWNVPKSPVAEEWRTEG